LFRGEVVKSDLEDVDCEPCLFVGAGIIIDFSPMSGGRRCSSNARRVGGGRYTRSTGKDGFALAERLQREQVYMLIAWRFAAGIRPKRRIKCLLKSAL